MPRPRSPDRDKAKKIWLESKGTRELKDIAAVLGVSDAQIRKWKSLDNWDSKKKGNVTNQQKKSKGNVTNHEKVRNQTNKNKSSIKYLEKKTDSKTADKSDTKTNTNSPSPFARYGNKNAEGNAGGQGAPEGNQYATGNKGGPGGPEYNKHAVRTHEFETFYYDDLDEEERAFLRLDDCFNDKYFLQRALIKDITRRELAIRKDIRELKNTPGGMVYESVTKSKGTFITEVKKHKKDNEQAGDDEECQQDNGDEESKHKKNNMVQTQENSSHVAKPVLIRVMQLEEALTRVQARKQAAIAQLHRMEMDDERSEREESKIVNKSGNNADTSTDQSKAMSKAGLILDDADPAVQEIYKKLLEGYNDLNDSFEDE